MKFFNKSIMATGNVNIVYYKVCDVIQSCANKQQLIVAGRYAANFLNLFANSDNIEGFRNNINLMISSKLRLLES